MEEMREGIPEKSNHEVMKEEESLTSSWGGRCPRRDEERLGRSGMAQPAGIRMVEGKGQKATGEVNRDQRRKGLSEEPGLRPESL